MVRGRVIKSPPNPEVNIKANIHNRFDVEVIDATTGAVKEKAVGYNTICDGLWSQVLKEFVDKTTYFRSIAYGKGTGVPATSDTKLFSQVSSKSVSNRKFTYNRKTGVMSVTYEITLLETEHIGVTLTEVGILGDSSVLCTHAMLQDMNGNPISITKTSTDIIKIYATVFVHFEPLGYKNGSIYIFLPGNNVDADLADGWYFGTALLAKLAGVGHYWWNGGFVFSGGFAPMTSYYSETGIVTENSVSVGCSSTINTSSKVITMTASRLPAASGNLNGLTRIYKCCGTTKGFSDYYDSPEMFFIVGGPWLPQGDTFFPASEITNEAVGTGDGTTTDFALDFVFAHDVTVYVDGVQVENVTVDYGVPTTDFKWYLFGLDLRSTPEYHIYKSVPYISSNGAHFNPMHEIGIGSITTSGSGSLTVKASNDLKEWVTVTTSSSTTVSIPTAYRHYKYWQFTTSNSRTISNVNAPSTFTGKVLHFDTPPAAGSVITADYKADCIAKDENHVFDMTVKIQLGEYASEEA